MNLENETWMPSYEEALEILESSGYFEGVHGGTRYSIIGMLHYESRFFESCEYFPAQLCIPRYVDESEHYVARDSLIADGFHVPSALLDVHALQTKLVEIGYWERYPTEDHGPWYVRDEDVDDWDTDAEDLKFVPVERWLSTKAVRNAARLIKLLND